MDKPRLDKIGIGLENGEYYLVGVKDIVELSMWGIEFDAKYKAETQKLIMTTPIVDHISVRLKPTTNLTSDKQHITLQDLINKQNISQIHIYTSDHRKREYAICWDSAIMTMNRYQKAYIDETGDAIINIFPHEDCN